VADKQKIVWLGEPINLYLAGRASYYPLINHTNFYKPSLDTSTVKKLGFWNQAMMAEWLNDVDLVVIDEGRLALLNQSSQTQPLVELIKVKINNDFKEISVGTNIAPGNFTFYEPKN